MTTDTIYILQLPYLNDSGAPVCVNIDRHDADRLRELKTHRHLTGDGVVVVTPVQRAVTDHSFQLGCEAY